MWFQKNSQLHERDWRPVWLADPCAYCGQPAAGLDHIVAKSRGGSNDWTNRAPACRRCDVSKGDIGLIQYLATRHRVRRLVSRRAARGVYGSPHMALHAERHMLKEHLNRLRRETLALNYASGYTIP